ncbi:hypothetical protein FA95DRAFT_1609945 [Auriscalpium vulgare]|uniref:Uncharacterized protein n=1 Tax=Auriscalpium vulgare TaxID=40419 RepID=A0ACB8RF73_9AGAM|nr:hypothetical protein FA95DRAFT_1609945 [Auriscalpium vulgare]
MPSCAICSGTYKSPTALPCGHVYCYDCITKSTRVSTTISTTVCPTCRAPFSIASVDVNLVPPHLRHYFLPPFRRLYLDTAPPPSGSSPRSPGSSSPTQREHVSPHAMRLQAENRALRESCHAWRQRAEAQAAASLGLAALIRVAKDQERAARRERDELARRCEALSAQVLEVKESSMLPKPLLKEVTNREDTTMQTDGSHSPPC